MPEHFRNILECMFTMIYYFFIARFIMKWIKNKIINIPKEERTDLYFVLFPLASLSSFGGFLAALLGTSFTMKIIDFIFG